MTVAAFTRLTSNLSIVDCIGFTSLQKVFIKDKIKEETFTINESEEVFEFDDINGLHFCFDITDCNCIITNPDNITYNVSFLP